MKRILLIILALSLLCSCSPPKRHEYSSADGAEGIFTDATTEPGPEARLIADGSSLSEGGMLISDGERLKYLDFETMEQRYVCSKEGCGHTDGGCQSLGMSDGAFLYGESVCYFVSDDFSTALERADLGGSNREQLFKLESAVSDPSGKRYILEGVLYFIAEDRSSRTDLSENYRRQYIYSYNLETGELNRLITAAEGWSAAAELCGFYKGWLYYTVSETENEMPEEYFSDPNFNIDRLVKKKIRRLNPESGENYGVYGLSAWSDGGMLVTELNEKLTLIEYSGGPPVGLPTIGKIVNGLVFSAEDGVVYDPRTGLSYEYLPKTKGGFSPEMIACYGGSYIVRNADSGEYLKLAESEVIGEEVELKPKPEPEAEYPYNLKWVSKTDDPKYKDLVSDDRLIAREAAKELSGSLISMFRGVEKYSEQTGSNNSELQNMIGENYNFSGEHHCFFLDSVFPYCAASVIDTDIKTGCGLFLSYAAVDPDTGSEFNLTVIASNDGRIITLPEGYADSELVEIIAPGEEGCGIGAAVYTPEGYLIREVYIMTDFLNIGQDAHYKNYFADYLGADS